ncbi:MULTISPECIES: GNAT family N-acetyltransferase [Pseudomonas]|uniref:GNAT family N-acetyltransferase n=1 Tax=Pseudomonas sessilinigenes TaxID=658629 RepID=A0ABX8MP85_9PSED|nr:MULTISPECIES: GNAT family N-acetyltransferase [Pseudomonas]AZC27097.1 GCN5-related N-acetyltransferase [Pseudomonas sessilinigenes]QIH07553.1 GNAT family N-acetyltransferase [Pseudomonas sp. BIOMIG1BAC]QXH38956.1 GNAT family N-acetyltransferase [Pseudomonas sessilinigenes]UMZ09499.1 GNAT family N-acetyltransferase [Pseudomonas sp. MPFS]
MAIRIEMMVDPGEAERAAILKPLRAHNRAKAGDPKTEAIALLVRDEQTGEILGGLSAEIFYRWLYIELLAIPEQTRGQGTGSRLLHMAEDLAREKGCVGIWLDTFDFQAPAFYAQHGFSQFGQLDGFPPGHQRLFLHKRLD